MSRIGNKPIEISVGVKVEIKGSEVTVLGPKGTLSMEIRPEVAIEQKDNQLVTVLKSEGKNSSAYLGMTRALLNNMVVGVSQGFEKKLELVGVGYRAKQNGSDAVTLSVGFSHPVDFKVPQGVSVEVTDSQFITIRGADKHLVGLTAANIRKIRKPEPYKGKGIKYSTEIVRRKQGKSGKV